VIAANPLDVSCAQIIPQQWAETVIKVAIKPMETAPLIAMWLKGDFPALLSVALSSNPDPDAIVSHFSYPPSVGQGAGDERHRGRCDNRAGALGARFCETRGGLCANQQRVADETYDLDIYRYPLRWEV
jgi:peptide/nickel transport system substrate-binding protein